MIGKYLAAIALIITACAAEASCAPPRMLLQGNTVADSTAASGLRTGFAIMRLPDGRFAFYDRNHLRARPLTLPDRDGQTCALLPSLPEDVASSRVVASSGVLDNTQVILTPAGQLVSVFVQGERFDKETAARVGLPLYLDLWIKQASLNDAVEPRMIWRGYNGSQMEYQQLSSGRLLVPHGSFQPHAKAVPPSGRHKTIIQYSDDGGRTWQESASKLTSPCYADFNGSNEGACEPSIEQLRDGRIWMLMRTQAGFLYESYSDDDGTTWRKAGPSRFNTSTGPPNIMRHQNGWLVVTWNNCEMPPRHKGEGVYGGRDALHIAVSDDDGRTWRGFREIYLDHRRNENPTRSGDRGTAYPLAAFTADGNIVVLAGQGEGGRNAILIDPGWIVETEARTDFSDGLEQWSVYKHHGPASRWWRARAVGCGLVTNPTEPTARSLHVRKADSLPPDGATWNFPNGWKGAITARMMVREGSHGGIICLNDRMFDPANDYGEEFAVFQVDIGGDGSIGNAMLIPDEWHDVRLEWDLSGAKCVLSVDDKRVGEVPVRNKTLNGISYIRFRSTAHEIDAAGFLVDSVSVSVEDPYAPPCSVEDQLKQERRYIENVVPLWRLES
ncbi:MAG: exo-alpha-sialidase [Planctomycetaceae bacterium]|nr:exo-alpha-sialidase [Planctomycetales bacterium]MCB9926549.1 exo-alpha-sialidase [Planctomycetaceae bacterium]